MLLLPPLLLLLFVGTDSTNPTWDWVQDLAYDIPNWAKEQAIIGAETAQALFGVRRGGCQCWMVGGLEAA